MKKRSKKQQRKVNLLERDDYRCGVHFGGCGKKITLDETTVDHIIPQNIFKYDEKYKERIKFLKRFCKARARESLAGGLLNLQPMCHGCNNVKKQGVFPPSNITKRCSNKCCNFIYIKIKGKWYFIVAYHLLKEDDLLARDSHRAKTAYFIFSLNDIQIIYKNKTRSEAQHILFRKDRRQNLIYEKNKTGGSVSEYNMIENNQRYSREEILGAVNGFYGENKNEKDVASSVINSQFDLEESYKTYIKTCNQNIELNPSDYQFYGSRGFAKIKIKDYKGAIEDLNKIIENKQNTEHVSWAYSNRGLCFAKLGNYNEAVADFNRSIDLNPNDSGAYNNRGLAKRYLGQHEESILDFSKSIDLDPNDADAYHNRSRAKLHLGQYKEATADCNKTIALNQNHSGAYNNRGIAKFKTGEYQEALKDFDKAVALNPSDKKISRNRESVLSALINKKVLRK